MEKFFSFLFSYVLDDNIHWLCNTLYRDPHPLRFIFEMRCFYTEYFEKVFRYFRRFWRFCPFWWHFTFYANYTSHLVTHSSYRIILKLLNQNQFCNLDYVIKVQVATIKASHVCRQPFILPLPLLLHSPCWNCISLETRMSTDICRLWRLRKRIQLFRRPHLPGQQTWSSCRRP